MEKKRSQAHSTRPLDQIIDGIPAFVACINPDFRYVFVNVAFERNFQRPRDFFLGRHVSEVVGESAFRRLEPFFRKAFGGETVSVEIDFEDLTGRHRYFQGTYTPDFDQQGQIQGVIIHQNDITERKKVEQSLLVREAQLRMAVDAAQLGTYELNLRTGELVSDERFRGIFGVDSSSKNEINSWKEFETKISPLDRRRVSEAIEGITQKKLLRLQEECRISTADTEETRWIHLTGHFVYDQSGQPSQIIGLVKDITARKQVQELRQENQTQIQALLDRMPQLIWISSAKGNVLYCNKRCLEYTGLSFPEFKLEGWIKAIHPDDAESVSNKWFTSLVSGTAFECEYRIRSKSGQHRWFLGRALPVRDRHDEVKDWLGTATDIHDLKISEERQEQVLKKMERLQSIAMALTQAKASDEITLVAVEGSITALDANAGSLLLFDPARSCLKLLYGRGYPASTMAQWEQLSLEAPLPIADCVRKKQVVLIRTEDEMMNLYPQICPKARPFERKSIAAFPLLIQGEIIGAMSWSFNYEQPFSPERLSFMAILAELCALGLERSRLMDLQFIPRDANRT